MDALVLKEGSLWLMNLLYEFGFAFRNTFLIYWVFFNIDDVEY